MDKWKKLFGMIVWLVIIGLFVVNTFPFFWVLVTSFKPSSEIFGAGAFRVIAQNPTLSNYTNVMFERNILRSIGNSFIVSALTMAYVVAIASMSAYIISRFNFRGKALLMGFILTVSMFPQMILVGPIFNMFHSMDLLNSYWVILPYSTITLPIAVWIMVAHFKRIPLSVEEAARIDGCSVWGTLWRIIFPLAAPGVFTTAIMTFIAAWNEFLLAFMFLKKPIHQTLTVIPSRFAMLYMSDLPKTFAALTIIALPIIITYICFQKVFEQGLTAGSVKG